MRIGHRQSFVSVGDRVCVEPKVESNKDYKQKPILWNVHILLFPWNLIIMTNAWVQEILGTPHQSELETVTSF